MMCKKTCFKGNGQLPKVWNSQFVRRVRRQSNVRFYYNFILDLKKMLIDAKYINYLFIY